MRGGVALWQLEFKQDGDKAHKDEPIYDDDTPF